MARSSADLYGSMGSVPDSVPVSGTGAGPMQIHANANQFGAQIGAGLEKLGTTSEEMGLHYQQLASEAKVNDDYANKYTPAAAKLREQYDMLDGQDKIHGYEGYINGLKELNNHFTQDRSPLETRLMGGLVNRHITGEIDGAKRELVESQKKFAADSTAKRIAADTGYASNNLNNPDIVNNVIDSNKSLAAMQAIDIGHNPETPEGQTAIGEAERSVTGSTVTELIKSAISQGNVNAAYKFRMDYDHVIPGDQQIHLDNILHEQSMQQTGKYSVDALKLGHPLPEVTGSPPSKVQAAIANAFHAKGADINDGLATIRLESSYGQNTGKIGNIGQNKSLGKGASLEEQAVRTAEDKIAANKAATAALGKDATLAEGYVVYQQGPGGGAALLRASIDGDKALALDILKPFEKIEKGYNAATAIQQNGGNLTMSAKDFVKFLTQKYDDNYRRAAIEVPKEYAQDTGVMSDASPGEAIIAPHVATGETVQPAATPKQALLNFDDKYPQMIERANAIPNFETRDRVLKSLTAMRSTVAGASSAYTQKVLNQAYVSMAKKDFNIDRDFSPELVATLAQDAPLTLKAAQEQSDKIAANPDMKVSLNNGPNYFYNLQRSLQEDLTPNHLANESQLHELVGRRDSSGINLKDYNDLKQAQQLPDQWKRFLSKNISQINIANGNIDGQGQTRAVSFYNTVNELMQEKLGKGIKLADMINPESKEYIGNIIGAYMPSRDQQIRNAAQQKRDVSIPILTDRSQYDALKSGDTYIRDGKKYRKP